MPVADGPGYSLGPGRLPGIVDLESPDVGMGNGHEPTDVVRLGYLAARWRERHRPVVTGAMPGLTTRMGAP